ncbi:MAG: hypothetical protein HQK66_11170 [Desulfamplus sp.]|nr:hypothetical protein [Desulfamplus sp.]
MGGQNGDGELNFTVTDMDGSFVADTYSFAASQGKSYRITLDYKYTWVTCYCAEYTGQGIHTTDNCSETSRTEENGVFTGTIKVPEDAQGTLNYRIDTDQGTITLEE